MGKVGREAERGGNGIFLREIIHGAPRPRGPRLKARGGSPSFIRCTSRAGRPRMRAPRAPPPPSCRARGGPPRPPGPCIGGSRPWRRGPPPTPSLLGTPRMRGVAWPRAGGDRGRREGGRQAGRWWPGRGGGCLAGRAGTGSRWAFSWGAARPTPTPPPHPRHGAWRRDCVTPPPLAGCRLEADRDSRRLGRPCPGMWAPRCLL